MPVHVDRRRFLGLGAASAAALVATGSGLLTSSPAGAARPAGPLPMKRLPADPFTLGVASGEPTPDGVVLWTRLAPDPLNGGGMPQHHFPVQWQVATDERFRDIVAEGTEDAVASFGHSVHAEVAGLEPAAWYFYRFRCQGELSPVGRTRTAPALGAPVSRLRFAHASCQSFTDGYYTAHRDMADSDLDLVVFVGDYIYEGAGNPNQLRRHEGTGEPVTIEQYRNRYAQYKSDPDLQANHAASPWIVVLDDHEVDNDWADEVPQDPQVQSRDAFLARRAVAFQAYYENMPLRRTSMPRGIDMQLYRRLTFGDLMDVHVLDTRQYRSDQDPAARLDPNRTIMGDAQEHWLYANLAGPTARWNTIAQQLVFSSRDYEAGEATRWHNDTWDNYVADRDALRDHIVATDAQNVVILTGDDHCNYLFDVKADWFDPASPTVATEIVGTSVTSGGNGTENANGDDVLYAENAHIKFINRRRGYVRHEVTPDSWTFDYRVAEYVNTPGSPVNTRRRYVIEDGRPGGVPA